VDGGRDDVALPTGHTDGLDSERDRLAGQQVKVAAASADRRHPEPLGIRRDDLLGLGAN